MQHSVDALALCIISGIAISFWYQSEHFSGSVWDWDALLRAFFHRNGQGQVVPGPLGIGLVNTVRVVFWATCPALCIGFFMGVIRSSPVRVWRMLGTVYVAVVRNLPPLVLIFIIHFFLASTVTTKIDWSWLMHMPGAAYLLPQLWSMPVFVSAVLTLALYEGAYIAEIARAGIAAVPRGQWEASASLGFTRLATLRRIILPQGFRIMLPSLVGQLASLVKDSAIVAVISVQELTFQAMEFMTSSGLGAEVWVAVTAVYLALCLCLTGAGKVLEKPQNLLSKK